VESSDDGERFDGIRQATVMCNSAIIIWEKCLFEEVLDHIVISSGTFCRRRLARRK
jgi:hypothetical protein